jgi:hypothetical protein
VSAFDRYHDLCDCETDAYANSHSPFLQEDGTSNKEAMERFGPLKVILGTIPAVYANDNVRSPLR